MSDTYLKIYDNDEFAQFVIKFEHDTDLIRNMSKEQWEVYKASKPEYEGQSKEQVIINRRRTVKYVLSQSGITEISISENIPDTLSKMESKLQRINDQYELIQRKKQIIRLLENHEKYSDLVSAIKATQTLRDYNALLPLIKDAVTELERESREKIIEQRKKWEKEFEASKVHHNKNQFINSLNKSWNKELISRINKLETLADCEMIEPEVIAAMEQDDIKRRNLMRSRLNKYGITEETDPELFDNTVSFSTFQFQLKKTIRDKLKDIFENLMKFRPKNLDDDIYIRSIDKRNYTENRNPNVFDIVELDIGIIYGSNIEEKMQFVKDEQKEIIKYCYFKIFERYANTYGDILFPIRYIKPTVYQASGIKATDTVNLCIIFELKTAKKNNQGE